MLIFQLILIQVVTFGGLVFALRKIMYSASLAEIKRLQQLSQESAKRSQELAQKTEEAQQLYKERIETAEAEAKKIKAQAQEEAEKLKEEILDKARHEAERIVNQALSTKEKVREDIAIEVREESIKLFSHIVAEMLGSKNQRLLHEGFVCEIIQEIEKIDPAKLAVTTDKGELLMSHDIDKEKKQKIEQMLSKKTGKNISLEEKVDENVVAGIIIRLGNLLIDGSLGGKIREAAEAARKG